MMQIIVLVLIIGAVANALPFDPFVVNGTDAAEGEFPYVISLRVNKNHNCGGSILDATHVLTAAHCVYRSTVTTLSIQYGTIYLDKEAPNAIAVESYEVHEGYTPGGAPAYINDVAVLTLESAIPLSSTAQPTKMPPQGDPTPQNAPAVLVGWGYNSTGGIIQSVLQKVNIICYSDEACSAAHGNNVGSAYHVCAGVPEGGKGQCSGDSGGPMTVNGIQRGTVSWSIKPCTIAPYPGVYANVASYTDWICSRASCTMG